MTYLTTNFKEFLRHKIHEEINTSEQYEPVKTEQPKQSSIFNYIEEFNKIMKYYDNI